MNIFDLGIGSLKAPLYSALQNICKKESELIDIILILMIGKSIYERYISVSVVISKWSSEM